MPTCWNGELGDTNDHKSHMAYTVDGTVAGDCPAGYNRRLPQVQQFLRINNYKGGKYQLSDGGSHFHVDFFNGWREGKLQEIIDGCPYFPGQEVDEYNPECGCTPREDNFDFLTWNDNVHAPACDSDVRRLIIDEATDVTTSLPRDACQGPPLKEKSWDFLSEDLFTCEDLPPSPPPPAPTRAPSTPAPTDPQATLAPTPGAPAPTVTPVTPAPVSFYCSCSLFCVQRF